MKKQVGLYEIEAIDNANLITVAVNLKEYFEKYKNKKINKKHKGIKKGTAGMSFDAHANRMSLHEHETVSKNPQKKFRNDSRSKMAL